MGGYGGSPPYQKRKYRCAIGRTRAGSHVSRAPSARTTYVSGSTSIRGNALLWIISRLPIERHLPTATARRARPRRRGTSWASAAFDTNVTAAVARARPKAPNIGRRSEEHTSELQSHSDLVCRLLLEKKNMQATAN